jgi:hypothetical protein
MLNNLVLNQNPTTVTPPSPSLQVFIPPPDEFLTGEQWLSSFYPDLYNVLRHHDATYISDALSAFLFNIKHRAALNMRQEATRDGIEYVRKNYFLRGVSLKDYCGLSSQVPLVKFSELLSLWSHLLGDIFFTNSTWVVLGTPENCDFINVFDQEYLALCLEQSHIQRDVSQLNKRRAVSVIANAVIKSMKPVLSLKKLADDVISQEVYLLHGEIAELKKANGTPDSILAYVETQIKPGFQFFKELPRVAEIAHKSVSQRRIDKYIGIDPSLFDRVFACFSVFFDSEHFRKRLPEYFVEQYFPGSTIISNMEVRGAIHCPTTTDSFQRYLNVITAVNATNCVLLIDMRKLSGPTGIIYEGTEMNRPRLFNMIVREARALGIHVFGVTSIFALHSGVSIGPSPSVVSSDWIDLMGGGIIMIQCGQVVTGNNTVYSVSYISQVMQRWRGRAVSYIEAVSQALVDNVSLTNWFGHAQHFGHILTYPITPSGKDFTKDLNVGEYLFEDENDYVSPYDTSLPGDALDPVITHRKRVKPTFYDSMTDSLAEYTPGSPSAPPVPFPRPSSPPAPDQEPSDPDGDSSSTDSTVRDDEPPITDQEHMDKLTSEY